MNTGRNDRMRTLAGPWRLARDPANEGKRLNWREQPPEADSRPAPVPGIIQQAFPGYHGVAWYWTTFHAPAEPAPGSFHAIRFREVDYFAEVWLNGVLLGSHEGAEFPFELRCDAAIRHNAENLIVVRVINPVEEPIDGLVLGDTAHRFKFSKNYMPGVMHNYGGILQGVEFIELQPVRIADVHAQADLNVRAIALSVRVRNDFEAPVPGRLTATVRLRDSDRVLACQELAFVAPGGEGVSALTLSIEQPRWWSPEEPQFYIVTVDLACATETASCRDRRTARCGFRELRVENGYFRLNGKRILVRGTMTLADYFCGDKIPTDHLMRDLIYAKAAGFNVIRFIDGGAYPEQLDLCDEIGLMVYEESAASWYLSDPRLKSEFSDLSKMAERYDHSMLGIVRRDRNHPSVVIWGLLNETFDGPVFRHAHDSLGKLRALDDSRLVLLNSGRWDGMISVGSLSNPKSMEWEPVWGKEIPGGLPAPAADVQEKREITFVWNDPLGRAERMVFGDFHKYPQAPYRKQDRDFIRSHAAGANPVFFSESGVGSLLDVINGLRYYRSEHASVESENAALLRKQAELLLADWDRLGMNTAYAFPDDLFVDSYRQQARQLRLDFDLSRSNPQFCGSCLLSLEDVNTGQGFWTFWRELKPGMLETLRAGWAPLRWCLFVEPGHVYAGRAFDVEAVLATEDALRPGNHVARFRIVGPPGVVWEKTVAFRAPEPAAGSDAPLTVPVLRDRVTLDAAPGVYELAADLDGAAPAAGRRTFHLSSAPARTPRGAVTLLGLGAEAEIWLRSHGVTGEPWDAAAAGRAAILIGDMSGAGEECWRGLFDQCARGSCLVFLEPAAFADGQDPVGRLPLKNRGCRYRFHDWVYHKECVARPHPVFEGLQGPGVLDWEYYDSCIPHDVFDGQDTPDDVAAVAFATGYQNGSLSERFRSGYACGLLLAGYRLGEGWWYLNTFPLLEQLDRHPAADRMLLNVVRHAQNRAGRDHMPMASAHNGISHG